MRGGIYKPGGVKPDNGAKENRPQQSRPAKRSVNNYSKDDRRYPMVLADPNVIFVLAKVGNKRKQFFRARMHCLSRNDPAHVSEKSAVIRRMRIAFLVRILVVHAVRRYPRDRSAFNRQRSARRKDIFHPLMSFVAAMRQQPVITHSDAETAAHPISNDGEDKALPGKEEEGREGEDMKHDEKYGYAPNDRARKSFVVSQKAHVSPGGSESSLTSSQANTRGKIAL